MSGSNFLNLAWLGNVATGICNLWKQVVSFIALSGYVEELCSLVLAMGLEPNGDFQCLQGCQLSWQSGCNLLIGVDLLSLAGLGDLPPGMCNM